MITKITKKLGEFNGAMDSEKSADKPKNRGQLTVAPEKSATVESAEHKTGSQLEHASLSREYPRIILDHLPIMAWLKDTEGRFLAGNAQFADHLGIKLEELIGKTAYEYFDQTLADAYSEQDQEVLSTGSRMQTVIMPNKVGENKWAEVYKTAVNVDNELIGTVGFARDLTEIKQLQAAVAQTKSEYRALIESLPLIIIRYNLSCKRIYVNRYSEQLSGVKLSQLLGKTPTEAWYRGETSMTAEVFQSKIHKVMQTGQHATFELRNQRDGQSVIYLVNIVPEYNPEQEVVGALMLASDMTEVSHYRAQVEHMAYHDSLTGLPNRSFFNKRINQIFEDANKQGSRIGLLMVDLDHFKGINDSLGHAVGDALLKLVTERIVQCAGSCDTLARLGGDEFAILVNDVEQIEDLAQIAKEMIAVLTTPFDIDASELFITASIGIAVYPEHTQDVNDLLKFADAAMYAAKKHGRNNYQYFAAELGRSMTHRLLMQTELRHAVEKNELYLMFQPMVNLHSAEIIAYEILLRWNNGLLGEVPPDDFIGIAEELGIILEIGQWVLMQTCKHAVAVNTKRTIPLIFSINLSPRQFLRHDILAGVKYCLGVTNCNPKWIALEITESLLLNDTDNILATLNGFAEMGMTIAIDDFGTGYSSLSYLNKFPINEVKIDRSFVRDITNDENDAKLVKAVIDMALSLGKELVAEGVETQAQADLLKVWGCHIGQGYFFSKPLHSASLSL
jgi:diguanylate cyclase (GGDEF)-like protein/PAS domain S-box-containing protein